MTHAELEAVVDHRPKGFGDQPGNYHSDAIFLMGSMPARRWTVFSPQPRRRHGLARATA